MRVMPSRLRIALLVLALVAALQWWSAREPDGSAARVDRDAAGSVESVEHRDAARRAPEGLPPEAFATLEAIRDGGPFPYARDGTVFQNRERRLPQRAGGYYREYTVATPGSRDRGARRIVAGGDPPEVFYYTDDHYRSFRRVEAPP